MNKKKVLFLCTGNSCRSQMAEGILKHFAGGSFEAASAGVAPATRVHPLAIQVMAEIGIDISRQKTKSVDQFFNQKFDYVITLCDAAKQSCPIFPGKYQQIHWDIEDPVFAEGTEEEKLTAFRKSRDSIKEKILDFTRNSQL